MNGRRVVICDDEGIAQLHLARSLIRAGWTIAGQAATGEQAVEVVLRERPDMVLMDFLMTGITGVEASFRILREYQVCIILLTGHDRAEVEKDAIKIGICGYLAKPVTTDMLLEAIPKALDKFNLGVQCRAV